MPYVRSGVQSGPTVSSQLPFNTLPSTNVYESNRGHHNTNINNVSSQEDDPTPRRPVNQLLNHSSSRDYASNSTPRPGGATQWPGQWNNDVWFERMQTRQQSNNNDRRRIGDERCFVRYVAPGYSDAVHLRSSHHRYPVDQFTGYRRDCYTGSGQTVDL